MIKLKKFFMWKYGLISQDKYYEISNIVPDLLFVVVHIPG